MTKKCIYFWLYVLFLFSIIITPLEIADYVFKHEGYWTEKYGTLEDKRKRKGSEGQWCEATIAKSDSFMREPINSRSNYGFILVGCYMILLAVYDFLYIIRSRDDNDSYNNNNDTNNNDNSRIIPKNEKVVAVEVVEENKNEEELQVVVVEEHVNEIEIRNGVLQYPLVTFAIGIFNVLLGLGSFYMHACNCTPGYKADNAGMVGVASFPVFMTPLQLSMGLLFLPTKAKKIENRSMVYYIRLFCSLLPPICQSLIFTARMKYKIWQHTFIMFGLLNILIGISVAMLLSSSSRGRNYYIMNHNSNQRQKHLFNYHILGIGILFTMIGGISWILDESKIWCFQTHAFPLNLFRGHALCHISMAVVSFCSYYWYRAEKIFLINSSSHSNRNDNDNDNNGKCDTV